jgi:hypothetical protein
MLVPQLLQNLALPSIFEPHSGQNFISSQCPYGVLVGEGVDLSGASSDGLGVGVAAGVTAGVTAGDTAGAGFAVVNPGGHFGCTAMTCKSFSPVL